MLNCVQLYNSEHLRSNKNAFQWDAYHPLVDRTQACTAQGGVCPRGCLSGGCLPRRCIPACNGADTPPVDRQTPVKYNLRKLRLRAVISLHNASIFLIFYFYHNKVFVLDLIVNRSIHIKILF